VCDELRLPGIAQPEHRVEGAGVGLAAMGATNAQIPGPTFGLACHANARGVSRRGAMTRTQ
jgi:hypothetical protein